MSDNHRAHRTSQPGDVPCQALPLMELIRTLFPICRSITGEGVRQTLDVIGQHIDLQRREIPTGTRAHDWEVPPEWNIRDAWIKNRDGRRIVDFRKSNLHVVGYSVPVHQWMSLDQLRPHLHCEQEHPDWIPYRKSYYEESWGFCLTQRELEKMTETEYEVCIDSTLTAGSLSFAEVILPGRREQEFFFSAHVCHPSLCNDNLSGIAVAVALAKTLAARRERNYSYRVLFVPAQIGSLVWLSQRNHELHKIVGGMTLVCLGDQRKFTYKKSAAGDAMIDRAAALVVRSSGGNVVDFHPYGYDERQFNAPGFRLPVGSLMRAVHGQFPEYHTSADNLELVSEEPLIESCQTVLRIVDILEGNHTYHNCFPFGEPQLGKHGLYRTVGGHLDPQGVTEAALWILNQSDGQTSLLDIAERSNLDFELLSSTAELLMTAKLVELVRETGNES